MLVGKPERAGNGRRGDNLGLVADEGTLASPEDEAGDEAEDQAAQMGLPGDIWKQGNEEESPENGDPEGEGSRYGEDDDLGVWPEHCQGTSYGEYGP